MKHDFQYQSGARSFDPDFGRVINASDGGYERGYEAGYTEGETAANAAAEAHAAEILTDCNEVLPTKGVETAETLEQVPQRIGEIVKEEDMLRYCRHIALPGLGGFEKEVLVLNLDYADSLDRMIYTEWGFTQYLNTKVKHLIVNCAKQILGARQAFYSTSYDYVLERITLNADLSKSTNALGLFTNLRALRVVDGIPLDLSTSTNNGNILTVCESVEEIRFAPNTIKSSIGLQGSGVLSDASIQSIIDCLVEVATAQTLTLHNTVGNKLTDAQKATITAKNWTLVY